MKSLFNEKGAALVYVLMIAAILMIMVPTLIVTNTTSKISTDLTEKQKIVTQLAVSGMQAIVKNPISNSQKIDYLLSNTINNLGIRLPTGQLVTYKQVVIAHGDVSESPITSNLSLNYDVVVSATIGTQTKKLVQNYNLAVEAISLVTSSPIMQPPNKMQLVAVTVNTLRVANNTPVSVELVTTNNGASLSPRVYAIGTINNNFAVVALVVPRSVPVGSYKLKSTVNAITDSTFEYKVSTDAPSATLATIISDGVVQNLTEAQFLSRQMITTAGTLFIPSNFLAAQTTNNSPITYTAAQGIFIDTVTGVTTIGTNSDIVLKACRGPIIVDGAGIGALKSNISLQAGTYISAKNVLFGNTSGNIRLTANDYIDLTGGNLYSTDIILSAFDTVDKIITTGATYGFFGGTTPGKVANNGTAVTCL
jgi:hypothetical protein